MTAEPNENFEAQYVAPVVQLVAESNNMGRERGATMLAGLSLLGVGAVLATTAYALPARPSISPGYIERAQCVSSGASKLIVASVTFNGAGNLTVKPRGHLEGVSNSHFSAPKVQLDTYGPVTQKIKFHETERRVFPAGVIHPVLTFTYKSKGTVHHETERGFGVDETGCHN
jgi:hypothetical protein